MLIQSKQRQNRNRPQCEINMVPYLDVMLVLLIVFMITAPVIQSGIAINLPKANETKSLPTSKDQFISVSIDRVSHYFLALGRSAPEEGPLTLSDVVAKLQAHATQKQLSPQEISIQIKGDHTIPYQTIVTTLESLYRASYSNIALMTEKSS